MTILLLSLLLRSAGQLRARWIAARKRRRDLAELAGLSSYELRDVGLSHRDAALRGESACRS